MTQIQQRYNLLVYRSLFFAEVSEGYLTGQYAQNILLCYFLVLVVVHMIIVNKFSKEEKKPSPDLISLESGLSDSYRSVIESAMGATTPQILTYKASPDTCRLDDCSGQWFCRPPSSWSPE